MVAMSRTEMRALVRIRNLARKLADALEGPVRTMDYVPAHLDGNAYQAARRLAHALTEVIEDGR